MLVARGLVALDFSAGRGPMATATCCSPPRSSPRSACDMVLEMDAVQEAYEKKAKRERGRKAKPQFPNCTSSENRDLTSAAAELDRLVAFILAQPQTEKCGDKKCLTEEALRRAFEASQRK